jgi:hypothetical protein
MNILLLTGLDLGLLLGHQCLPSGYFSLLFLLRRYLGRVTP